MARKEILVFETDECGYHSGPMGKLAKEKYGAEDMFGVGFHGNSYGIPTLDMFGSKLSIGEIRGYIEKFIEFANKNRKKTFILTRIGLEKYGMSEEESDELLSAYEFPNNVKFWIIIEK